MCTSIWRSSPYNIHSLFTKALKYILYVLRLRAGNSEYFIYENRIHFTFSLFHSTVHRFVCSMVKRRIDAVRAAHRVDVVKAGRELEIKIQKKWYIRIINRLLFTVKEPAICLDLNCEQFICIVLVLCCR